MQGVRSFFNDHPFAVAPQTTPKEVQFRWDGLTSVMSTMGIDWWWLDTNWRFTIPGAFGVDNIVWGGHLYSTVMDRYNAEHNRTDERGMVLHMARSPHPHPAHHRFPVWWTGDDKGLGTKGSDTCFGISGWTLKGGSSPTYDGRAKTV